MTNKTEHTAKACEEEVFELLANANEQYRAYIEICDTTNALLPEDQTCSSQHNWDYPLTLTMNKER